MSRWFAVATVLVACGGGAVEAPKGDAPDVNAPVAREILDLTYRFRPTNDPLAAQLQDLMRARLVAVGYKLVDGTPDVDVAVVTRSQREASMFNVSIDGQSAAKTHVWATVSLFGGTALVDRVEAEWSGDEGKVDGPALDTIISSIGYSSGLRRHAASVERRRQGEGQPVADAQKIADTSTEGAQGAANAELEAKQKEEQERAWAPASRECGAAATATACDALNAFQSKYPNSSHAAEARSLLERTRPKMDALQKDEGAWQAAEVTVCRSARTRAACAKVEVYTFKYPAGLHVLEANELMRGVK